MAAEGMPAGPPSADQEPGRRVRDPAPVRAGMTGYHLILRWNASSGVSDWRRASEKFHNRLQKGSKPCMVPGWGEAGLGSSRRRSYRPTGVGSIERAATNAIMFFEEVAWIGHARAK